MSDEGQQKKDEGKSESEHINLKVTGQDGSVVHFKIKRNTPLKKLMTAYCDRAGLKMASVRFRFDGNPLNTDDTPSRDEGKSESEHINLKVTGQDGSVVHFKIKRNTPLKKLMSAYCDRAGLKMGAVRFRFDGNPLNTEDTPSRLDMEDGDSIDVFQQQTGGRSLH